ncbi:hypothetical protein D3C79_504190 [compost metagenome]
MQALLEQFDGKQHVNRHRMLGKQSRLILVGQVFELLRRPQQVLGLGQQGLAQRRQHRLAPLDDEQLLAQQHLHAIDRMADRRLGFVHVLASLLKAAALHGGDERAPLIETDLGKHAYLLV